MVVSISMMVKKVRALQSYFIVKTMMLWETVNSGAAAQEGDVVGVEGKNQITYSLTSTTYCFNFITEKEARHGWDEISRNTDTSGTSGSIQLSICWIILKLEFLLLKSPVPTSTFRRFTVSWNLTITRTTQQFLLMTKTISKIIGTLTSSKRSGHI